jgi:hypothetical protein
VSDPEEEVEAVEDGELEGEAERREEDDDEEEREGEVLAQI